jgi:hypothetical protein
MAGIDVSMFWFGFPVVTFYLQTIPQRGRIKQLLFLISRKMLLLHNEAVKTKAP